MMSAVGGSLQERAASANEAERHHQLGVEHHLRRSLDEASREYARALDAEPPRDLTPDEMALVKRFAPRVYVTPTEFFPLKDVGVIVHPDARLLAYHFFWEDDIDFPEDNDPCDHELVWIQYSPDMQAIERIWTYFHDRMLVGAEEALADARQHGMRPRVNVQWGKHGSMPLGWETMTIVADQGDIEAKYIAEAVRKPPDEPVTLAQYNQGTFRKLSTEGRRLSHHPLGRRLGWPDRFVGQWSDFIDFSRAIDPVPMLDRTRMVKVSRWNSATIDQHFLTYNFRPKTEWPRDALSGPATRTRSISPVSTPVSLDDFLLPPKSIFDRSMPRYPNAWFYIDTALAPSYELAVKLVTERLRSAMRLRELYGPFDNPEGCDFEVRLEHLQPWEDRGARALQHAHAFHMRYYHSALAARQLEQVRIRTPQGDRAFFRLAASAHYEVEHTNPNHADVETCPICGRTGEYKDLEGNLVELVHDPLGLELLMTGTIRGDVVRLEDYEQDELKGLAPLERDLSVRSHVFPAQTEDKNTLRIGVIVITAR